jgi:hypothetical protein
VSWVTDAREALADAIRTAVDGSDPKTEVYETMQPAPMGLVSIDIYPADPFRRSESAGMGDIAGSYVFKVRARIDEADLDANQAALDSLMSDDDPLCIAAALMADQRLGDLAFTVDVDGPSGYTRYQDVDRHAALLGVDWTVEVIPAYS